MAAKRRKKRARKARKARKTRKKSARRSGGHMPAEVLLRFARKVKANPRARPIFEKVLLGKK